MLMLVCGINAHFNMWYLMRRRLFQGINATCTSEEIWIFFLTQSHFLTDGVSVTSASWCNSTSEELWSHFTTMVGQNHVTLWPGVFMNMSPYGHVTLWPCHFMAMSLYEHVTLWPCHLMNMSPYGHVTLWTVHLMNMSPYGTCLGLARTVRIHRIWPYIWWFPCQISVYTPYIYGSDQP